MFSLGDEDWVKFYALATFINPDTGVKEPYTYRIKAGNLGENCKPVIELYLENNLEDPIRNNREQCGDRG